MDCIVLRFVWLNKQECNVKTNNETCKDICNYVRMQKTVADISENISLVFCRDMDLSWYRRSYKECCSRKQRDRTAWLLAGVCKM